MADNANAARLPTRRRQRGSWPLEQAAQLRWYALVVPPQREFVAQNILHDRGLATFVPVERRWRRRNRFGKAKELISYALAPRYVFVGFQSNQVRWLELFKIHIVTGVVGHDGEPREIPNGAMRALIGRYSNGLNAPDVQRYMRSRREFGVGDTVEVTAGPFVGLKVMVEEIERAKAKIIIELFGTRKEIRIPLDILEAA